MLNRRLLRSKAVQALYASTIAAQANQLLAHDEIAETYSPDLNSMLPQNLERLEGMKRLGVLSLDELIKNGRVSDEEVVPTEVVRTARQAHVNFNSQNKADRASILNRVLKDTEGIFEQYVRVLSLLPELAHQAMLDRERLANNPENTFPLEAGLDDNRVVRMLIESEEFELERIRRGISWSNDMAVVRRTYREGLAKDEKYLDYCQERTHSAAEDQQLAQHVLRQIVLHHPVPVEYFEQQDLYWEEHYELIRSMAIKTLRSADSGKIQLSEFTDDWDEDRFFVEELFTKAVENDETYQGYLAEQLKNWDVERIALMDMVIMKVALAELINFPSIPVKVTINEFIEIAKRYSTLKSAKFVNGNLDRLAARLTQQGVIRKSGRGLIDNK